MEAQDGPLHPPPPSPLADDSARLKTNGQALQLQLLTNTATTAGPKPQAAMTAPFPILMVTELPWEPPRMANPYDTCHCCKCTRKSAGAINFLPFVSAVPKMAIQIPKTCSTQYRLIFTACLAPKGKDYMGGTQKLTASPFAPSFPAGPGEPRDPCNNNRNIISTISTPSASASI